MTLLTIVQDAADLVGIARPDNVVASSDTSTRQLLALANIEGKGLARRFAWQELERIFSHTTLAAELQGALATIMPGYNWAVDRTLWNQTQQDPARGSLTSQEWQYLQAITSTGPYSDFRFRDGNLYLYPAPAAGDTFAGEYVSKYWCQSSGGSDQEEWAADTDVGVLDEHLMTLGLRYRYLQAKGLPYQEAKMEYEIEVKQAMARNKPSQIKTLNPPDDYYPSVRAPEGSWVV